MKILDSIRAFVYKLGPEVLAASLAAAMVLSPGVAGADLVLGVPMPSKAAPDGPFRYVVPGTSLKDVVKFFKKKFKHAPHVFLDALDHPEAKVIHIRSGDGRTAWEGVNLWIRNRRVHIVVLPRKGSVTEKSTERRSEERD
jgi:hypothetical protein